MLQTHNQSQYKNKSRVILGFWNFIFLDLKNLWNIIPSTREKHDKYNQTNKN